jgi:hypothetical protein
MNFMLVLFTVAFRGPLPQSDRYMTIALRDTFISDCIAHQTLHVQCSEPLVVRFIGQGWNLGL